MESKTAASKTTIKHQSVLTDDTQDNENNYSLCWSSFGMEYNRVGDTIRKDDGMEKIADFVLNVNEKLQKSSSQSKQRNGITLFNQQKTNKLPSSP